MNQILNKSLYQIIFQNIKKWALNSSEFFNHLENEKIEIYVRGKTIGFKDLEHNRKHRLKTLGLEAEFEEINSKLSKVETEEKAKADEPEIKKEKPVKPEAEIKEPEKSFEQPEDKVQKAKEQIKQSRESVQKQSDENEKKKS